MGADKGWLYHFSYKLHVSMSPRLAFSADTAGGNVNHFWRQRYFVGGHDCMKNSNAMQWKKSTPTAREIRSYAAATDVRTGMAKLYALPGLRLLGTRRYSATCTTAQVNAFLQFFYGTSQKTLAMDKIKTVTVSFWTIQPMAGQGKHDWPVLDRAPGHQRGARLQPAPDHHGALKEKAREVPPNCPRIACR